MGIVPPSLRGTGKLIVDLAGKSASLAHEFVRLFFIPIFCEFTQCTSLKYLSFMFKPFQNVKNGSYIDNTWVASLALRVADDTVVQSYRVLQEGKRHCKPLPQKYQQRVRRQETAHRRSHWCTKHLDQLQTMAYPTINNALRFEGLPGSDLRIVEKDVLPLPANEILVKVHAASINPCDIQLWRSGLVAVVAGDKGMGKDFSGTIVAVGENVKGWTEGDEIFGLLFHIVSPSHPCLEWWLIPML